MSKVKIARRLGLATVIATFATVGLTAGTAQAYPVNLLCRAWTAAPVYNSNGHWMYSIQPGYDMRVTYISPNADPNGRDIYFGHGNGRQNGYSYSNYFNVGSYHGCRQG